MDSDSEVVVCEQISESDFSEFNDNPRFRHIKQHHNEKFNKSLCWNYGFKQTRGKYIVGLDADIVMDAEYFKTDTIANALEQRKLVYPFANIVDMTDAEAQGFLKDDSFIDLINDNIQKNRLRSGTRCYGGIWYMTRDAYVDMGGYDENFKSWGGEDDCFAWIATAYFGNDKFNRFRATCYHLWHPHTNTNDYLKSAEYNHIQSHKVSVMTKHTNAENSICYCKKQRFLNGLVGYEKTKV